MPSQGKHVDASKTMKTRGRTGCLNCRLRRKKCDEKKPSCSKCNFRGEKCNWDNGIRFRCSGLDATHPSMTQPTTAKPQSQSDFQIISPPFNPTESSALTHNDSSSEMRIISAPSEQHSQSFEHDELLTLESAPDNPKTNVDNFRALRVSHGLNDASSSSSFMSSGYRKMAAIGQPLHELTFNSFYVDSGSGLKHPSPTSGSHSSPGAISSVEIINSDVNLSRDAADLEALDYLMSPPSSFDFFLSSAQSENLPPTSDPSTDAVLQQAGVVESPDSIATYYPDPAHRELHSVLHNQIIETTRATTLTRQVSPDSTTQIAVAGGKDQITSSFSERPASGKPTPGLKPIDTLTRRRELELWQNYLEGIAAWLDMFDVERHFQLKIPLMAKTADHLRYSVLTLSARQLERLQADKPYTESLTLHQKAIELIVRDLHTLDTSVIASCVLLCVLEMMSSSSRAWVRHLDGCAILLQAAGINGTVGGVRQALFWCFARMDVWGGFLSETRTKIPTSHWFMPSASMSSAVNQFKTGSMGFDSYANYAVFLCASAVNVLSNRDLTGRQEAPSDFNASYSARWKAIFDLLEDWYNSRPEAMQPLMTSPMILEDHQHPFPIILYGTSTAINSNQLYHASSLLMLQEKPKEFRVGKSHKSIQWHARQVCGIATSNRIHGPWINALQPLWIAGKVMSHPIEHQVILETLARLEKETGWATSWRVKDLKEYWGEIDI